MFTQMMLGFLGMSSVSSSGCPDEVNKKDIQTKKGESTAMSTLQTSGMPAVSPTRGPGAGKRPSRRRPGMAEENDDILDGCTAYVGFPVAPCACNISITHSLLFSRSVVSDAFATSWPAACQALLSLPSEYSAHT